jgi:hypothetical protein
VPGAGLEPARPKGQRILSPLCLPISPSGQKFMLTKHESLYIFILPFWLLFPMIILFFIIFSCLSTKKTPVKSSKEEDVVFFTFGTQSQWEGQISGTQSSQELAQLHWLRGINLYEIADLIQARSLGCTCLQEDISLTDIPDTIMNWSSFDWKKRDSCMMDMGSEVISLPKSSKNVACVTWTILSWAKLLQYYQMDREGLDSRRMLYLSTWLFEQERCLDSAWVSFAIAMGFMNSGADVKDPIGMKKREEHAKRIITSLWNHDEIGIFVQLWYITFRVNEGKYTNKDREGWLEDLKQLKASGRKKDETHRLENLLIK